MEKKNFKEKNLIDIKFSIIAFFVLMVSYLLLCMIFNGITGLSGDGGFLIIVVLLGYTLVPSLFGNIIIQFFLNVFSAKNKIKSYLFFVALNIDVIALNFMFLMDKNSDMKRYTLLLLFSIIPIFIKSIITIYYYKKLQKITFNEKINH